MKIGDFNPFIGVVGPEPIDKIGWFRDGLPPEDSARVEQQLREALEVESRRCEMGVEFVNGPKATMRLPASGIAQQVADLIAVEQGTMMVEPVEVFEAALKESFTVVVFSNTEPKTVVGFATLFLLVEGWYELRSLVVKNHEPNSFRNRGIATEIVWEVLRLGFHHLPEAAAIMATVKDDYAITAIVRGGMGLLRYDGLPPAVRCATCTCAGPGEGGLDCRKAGGLCRLAAVRR